MKITYIIREDEIKPNLSTFELTIQGIEILNSNDARLYDADIGDVILEPDYKQTFDTLEGAYAKVSAFASKYHLGDEVRTIQEKPIKHYEFNKGMWVRHNTEKK
jgi:hypothetical protein